MHNPTHVHLQAVKHIVHYIKGTIQHELKFKANAMMLLAYSDADWIVNSNNRRSTLAYYVYLGAN